ncbi:MAG: CPBP family intramembrane metalloprotease [Acidobacteriota bacterium]|nr:CPBP family intramembrane metalloprotease [Acidobacteriota bacterium]
MEQIVNPASPGAVPPAAPSRIPGLILRVGIFILFALLGYFIFPVVMFAVGGSPFIVAALSTFASAAIANAVVLRIYERGQLADIGLGWTSASRRNLAFGLLGGIGGGLAVTLLPIIGRVADLDHNPGASVQWPSLAFISVVLLFGAVGEEMLFRGYAFQILVRGLGAWATILPFGVLFAVAHSPNLNFGRLAFLNTMLWGILFGYAFLRSGDLWLPIGLHFGWNWVLPLLGVNLSGFTMVTTGYTLHWRADVLWSGGEYGPEAGLLCTLVVFALAWYLHRVPIQRQEAFLLREPS